jgi:hypothetical protein
MPRYFFNIRNHIHTEDFTGTELGDLRTARREALKDIADIMLARSDAVGNHWPQWSIEICGKDRKVLLVVPFSSN